MAQAEPIEERLLSMIEESVSGCWLFSGYLSHNGYGRISVRVGNRSIAKAAHRVAFETWNRPIPSGLVLDHLCRNRRCVNPFHLEPVTNQENVQRGESKSVRLGRMLVCQYGHSRYLYTAVDSNGRRFCYLCRRETTRRSRRKQRESRLRDLLDSATVAHYQTPDRNEIEDRDE